jgi:hypothetical protein
MYVNTVSRQIICRLKALNSVAFVAHAQLPLHRTSTLLQICMFKYSQSHKVIVIDWHDALMLDAVRFIIY